jgi:hypothetical protein
MVVDEKDIPLRALAEAGEEVVHVCPVARQG